MKENVKEFSDHVFNKEWNEVYSTEQFETDFTKMILLLTFERL